MPEKIGFQDITIELVLIAALVLLNAVFSAAEIATVSMRRTRIRHLADEEGDARAGIVQRLIEQPGKFLATIQIGVTLAGFFASAVGAVSLVVVMTAWLQSLPVPLLSSNAYGFAFVFVTGAIAYVTLVLGELVPKNLAMMHTEPIALQMARPILLISKIAAPVVWVLTASTNVVLRMTGSSRKAQVNPITEEEILAMVASGEEEGVVEPSERRLIGEVFEFGDTLVGEVMVPRVDVRALAKDASLAEAREAVVETGHTRLPVYDGSIDNIIGVVHAKDVLEALPPQVTQEQASRPVTSIMRPVFYVPDTKRVSELLQELQRQRLHLAAVIDEYGGTAGIVTLDNLLEEIVGPIRDEYDSREEPDIQIVDGGQAIVSGGADLGDVAAALGVDLETEGVDTVAGLVYSRLGRIPNEGDVVELPDSQVEVVSMRGRRVLKARITRREIPVEDSNE